MPQEIKQILVDRQEQYGDALDNFEKIGKIWGALLNINPIEPHQVALMMDALKTVRVFDHPNYEDGWADKEGYISLAIDIVTR